MVLATIEADAPYTAFSSDDICPGLYLLLFLSLLGNLGEFSFLKKGQIN